MMNITSGPTKRTTCKEMDKLLSAVKMNLQARQRILQNKKESSSTKKPRMLIYGFLLNELIVCIKH